MPQFDQASLAAMMQQMQANPALTQGPAGQQPPAPPQPPLSQPKPPRHQRRGYKKPKAK